MKKKNTCKNERNKNTYKNNVKRPIQILSIQFEYNINKKKKKKRFFQKSTFSILFFCINQDYGLYVKHSI